MLEDTAAAKIPRHVAIIPDGNRRWARGRSLAIFRGHERGIGAFKDMAEHAADQGVEHLSLWGMSLDNLTKRSSQEVNWLLRMFEIEFNKLAESREVHERQTRIRAFGQWREKFPEAVCRAIEKAEDATKDYANFFLNFFLAYDGRNEMVRAVREIVEQARDDNSMRVTGKLIKEHLYTRELPPVDLVIRTAGESHLSAGFMMWDVASAELYFTKTFWPDFKRDEFDRALSDYAGRRRRFGK